VATISADRVASRVGSRFSNIRDVIQVRLVETEPVEVLEEVKSGVGPTAKSWYRIAPPSGEFRWVFGKYIARQRPPDGVRQTRAAENRQIEADIAESQRPEEPTPSSVRPVQYQLQDDSQGEDHTASEPSEPSANDGPVWRDASQSDSQPSPAPASSPDFDPIVEQPDYDYVPPRGLSPEEFRAELEEIDMRLSTMVVEEPTVWAFGELQQRAEILLAQAETAVERGRARALVRRLARFDDIKRRYDRVNQVRHQVDRSNSHLRGISPAEQVTARKQDPDDRFDGVGVLTRVVSSAVGAPRYALFDEDGRLRCYVSPAPGVSLRHYLGRRVGVNGASGYMPEQRARHVTAQHVAMLPDHGLQ
jgi:hypothetical protein